MKQSTTCSWWGKHRDNLDSCQYVHFWVLPNFQKHSSSKLYLFILEYYMHTLKFCFEIHFDQRFKSQIARYLKCWLGQHFSTSSSWQFWKKKKIQVLNFGLKYIKHIWFRNLSNSKVLCVQWNTWIRHEVKKPKFFLKELFSQKNILKKNHY